MANPGAEDPTLAGWENHGFTSEVYGASPEVPGAAGVAGDGSRLFVAQAADTRLTQTVSVADLAQAIDGSAGQPAGPGLVSLSFGGQVGAYRGRPDSVRVVLEFLDAAGVPTGSPATVGPQTPEQRLNDTVLLGCGGLVRPPLGTRQVRLVLQAVHPSAPAPAARLGPAAGGRAWSGCR